MLFNTAKKRDFTPTLSIDGEEIDLVEEMKLLGVIITSDLKWSKNTQYTTKRGYNKLWILRRLKQNGANTKELCDIYQKHVRSSLEYSAVVWHAGLTKIDSTNLERVQKSAFSIILGKEYKSYENSLNKLGMPTLHERREILCAKFAKKALKSEKFSTWFVRDRKEVNTRRKANTVREVDTRTTRFRKSALPFITSILNKT
jgi:hypothetical protein